VHSEDEISEWTISLSGPQAVDESRCGERGMPSGPKEVLEPKRVVHEPFRALVETTFAFGLVGRRLCCLENC
jgi:hypothetical protein